ncbi:MAG: rhomboid family intramembrane serine protease [Butyrivibrio sp.]|nr:rhomboid family intramembrane serine protease [Butyrivibrio sp.]
MSEGVSNAHGSQEEFWNEQRRIYKTAYVTIALVIINVIVYLLCITDFGYILYENGALMLSEIGSTPGKLRILYSIFLHADANHLAGNMLMLVVLGGVIENYTGHIVYFILYMLSGIFGNIFSLAIEYYFCLDRISVGASGAIMGLVGFLTLWLLAGGPSKTKIADMRYRLIVFGLYIVQSCFIQNGANTEAHLGGFLMGVVVGVINIIIFKNIKKMEGLA